MKRILALSASLLVAFLYCAAAGIPTSNDLSYSRDTQDLDKLDSFIRVLQQNSNSAEMQYRLALAYSYAAEVAFEKHDKPKSETYAETGLAVAQKMVDANGKNASYHQLLGELCGQVIPANVLMGTIKYGKCAREEINTAIQLDPKLAIAYVSRGVGNYYLPPQMGGGPQLAIADFDKAIQLDPNLADAYMWKGIALRKLNKDEEAHQALSRAVQIDPNRIWAKEQLAKTPAK
ncbi:MAG TPA: tetratricopeptide repeat protein [Bryobacteraceae bacterium]|nr:tetratricopeptide repeat protein [Bryobacteraceae bacterium]